jgi:hypothetical protein
MAQTTFEDILGRILARFHIDDNYTIYEAIAEIKAAVLATMEAKQDGGSGESESDYCEGYNQAIKDITEKFK